MEDFKQKLKHYEEEPPNINWDRLHSRLSSRKTSRKMRQFRNMSIAAMFFALLAFGFTIQHLIQNRNPKVYTSASVQPPLQMETLKEVSDELYSINRVIDLKKNYSKLNF